MAWVYILRGSTGRHYIGSAADLEARFAQHLRGHTATTKRLGEKLEIVAKKETKTLDEARELERILKWKKNPQLAIYHLSTQSSLDGIRGWSGVRFSSLAFCSVPVGLCAIERWTLRCGVRASGILVTSCITRISWIAFSRAEIPIG